MDIAELLRTEVPPDARARMVAVAKCFRDAPEDADLLISYGFLEIAGARYPALAVRLEGGPVHGITTDEARALAGIIERVMAANPEAVTSNWLELAALLRDQAEGADAEHPTGPLQ